jgi:hypothetical protein
LCIGPIPPERGGISFLGQLHPIRLAFTLLELGLPLSAIQDRREGWAVAGVGNGMESPRAVGPGKPPSPGQDHGSGDA